MQKIIFFKENKEGLDYEEVRKPELGVTMPKKGGWGLLKTMKIK